MKALPALAALLSILACALWIAALTAPWYHAPNRDGTEQRMGLFGSYHSAAGHPMATAISTYHDAVEDAMGITALREREEAHHRGDKHHQSKHKHEHEHEEEHEHEHQHAHDRQDECECKPHPTKRPIIIPIPIPIPIPVPSPVPATNTPLPTQQQPITPEDQTTPKGLHRLKKHHHGEPYEEQQQQREQNMGNNEKATSLQTGAGTVTPTTAPGATGGAAGSTPAPTPRDEYSRHGHPPAGTPCRGKHAHEHTDGHTHANADMAKARDHTLPYDETWVMAMKVILILAVIVSGIAAFLQLLMAWTVGRHVHKGSWVTSPITALVATSLIALAGVHGLVALFLFLSKRDQLPHGQFDYGYTLNIVATALALISPLLFWYTLDTSKTEHLLGEEPVIGRRKYASVE